MRRQQRRRLVALATLAALLVGLSACSRTASTRFYTLSPISKGAPPAPEFRHLSESSVGIGPVALPDYLDRPQIVTRDSPSQVRLAEFDKWAGTLKYAVPRIIAENLSALTGSDQVYAFPWKSALPIHYQVTIDILRFDAEMASHAELTAQWTVFRDDGRIPLTTRTSNLRQRAASGGYTAVVEAESQALAALSREIAAALSKISSPQERRPHAPKR